MTKCIMPGCERPRSGHANLCASHRQRQRRHGAADQPTISAARIKPIMVEVTDWIDRRRDPATWGRIEARWTALVDHARGHLAEHAQGRPTVRWTDDAMRSVVAVAEDAEAREVIATVCAVFVLRHREPRSFRDDRSVLFQAARRFRALTDRHVGTYYDGTSGVVRRVYRTPPPRSTEALGRLLAETFGAVALFIAKDMDKAKAAQEKAKVDLWAALGSGEVERV